MSQEIPDRNEKERYSQEVSNVSSFFGHLYQFLSKADDSFWEVQHLTPQVRPISLTEAELPIIGECTDARDRLILRVSIPKPAENDINLFYFNHSLNQTKGTLEEYSEVVQDEKGNEYFEFDVFYKSNDLLPNASQDERNGYDKLEKLGIPSLKCIFPIDPSTQDVLELTDNDFVLTFVEKGLRPLSEVGTDGLTSEYGNNTTPLIEAFSILSRLHRAGVTHGDADLKNWGYLEGKGVYLFDVESLIDFEELNYYATPNNLRGGMEHHSRFIEKNQPLDAETINQIWKKAVLEDIHRLVISCERKVSSDDIRVGLNRYLEQIWDSERFSDKLKKELEATIEQLV
jgi:hypothetical protein